LHLGRCLDTLISKAIVVLHRQFCSSHFAHSIQAEENYPVLVAFLRYQIGALSSSPEGCPPGDGGLQVLLFWLDLTLDWFTLKHPASEAKDRGACQRQTSGSF
jgi:hypothetical protein